MSPLCPLNQRDLIWLKTADNLATAEELETLKFSWETKKNLSLILQDIRLIALNLIPFKSDAAFKDFLTTLPSFKGDAKKDKEDRRWKVRKRNPGEILDWKKQRVAATAEANGGKTPPAPPAEVRDARLDTETTIGVL